MRVTASKVGLLAYCAWWARPEAKWDTTTSKHADRGTRFHKAMDRYLSAPSDQVAKPEDLEEDIREEYKQATAWLRSTILRDSDCTSDIDTEVAFAWDPATDQAHVLDVIDRQYRPSSRLCGTADLVVRNAYGVDVYDYKTGSGADAGPQLRALGLMAARAYGVSTVRVAALEVSKSGVVEVCAETLDEFELAGVAGDLAEQIAAVDTAEPKPGPHCGELYCPARLTCPLGNTAMAEVVDVVPADSLVRRREYRITDPITTPEHAAWALDVCRLVGAKLDAIKDSIKAMVPPEGLTLEDGSVLRETKATITAFDKRKALALCKQLGATPEQIAALNYTFEKSNGLRVSGGSAKPRTKRTRAS